MTEDMALELARQGRLKVSAKIWSLLPILYTGRRRLAHQVHGCELGGNSRRTPPAGVGNSEREVGALTEDDLLKGEVGNGEALNTFSCPVQQRPEDIIMWGSAE